MEKITAKIRATFKISSKSKHKDFRKRIKKIHEPQNDADPLIFCTATALSPDEQLLVGGFGWGHLCLWNLCKDTKKIIDAHTFKGISPHEYFSRIYGLAISKNNTILSASANGSTKEFDAQGNCLHEFKILL